MTQDEPWMRLALAEARKGVGRSSPNPPVGAVLVKDDVLLGSGWHQAAGQPHAEPEALAAACAAHGRAALRGATIYVTLEPCSTQGRTPPCTQAIIEAGIARVVYACVDHNPVHAGRADAVLTNAGIAVTSGVCAEEAGRLLRPFFKVRRTGLPWIIWKAAMSLDGRLTRAPGECRWLTGEAARNDVQYLRATADAILTTGATVRADRPALTIRRPELLEGRRQPWRVVFTDHPQSLPAAAPLFTDAWRERTLVRPRHHLTATLRALAADHGVLTAMTEAGGRFAAALFKEGLIDEVVLYYAPLLCGSPTLALADSTWHRSLAFTETELIQLGDDFRFRGVIAT